MFGLLGIYSFHGNKIITISEGGTLVSDDRVATQAREMVVRYEHT